MAVCQSGELIKINDWSRMRLWTDCTRWAVILHSGHLLHSSLWPTTASEQRGNTHFDYLPLITERLGQLPEHISSHFADREVVLSRRATSLVTDHVHMLPLLLHQTYRRLYSLPPLPFFLFPYSLYSLVSHFFHMDRCMFLAHFAISAPTCLLQQTCCFDLSSDFLLWLCKQKTTKNLRHCFV